jgi:formate dehydrogenase major subunit/NADH-quinone oxidoreductase subunit G
LINITINETEIKTKNGTNLLWAALDNGFYIPNLCSIREMAHPVASCRLCFVEINGESRPVTSCTIKAKDGMAVKLDTDKVKRIRNTAFELLLSHHHIDCAHCDKNRNCELQKIAAKLKLKLKLGKLHNIPRELPIDSTHPEIYYDPNKCVLCGRCVYICHKNGTGTLDYAYRGISTLVSTFAGIPLSEAKCNSCLDCAAVCPVGSLVVKPGISIDKSNAKK